MHTDLISQHSAFSQLQTLPPPPAILSSPATSTPLPATSHHPGTTPFVFISLFFAPLNIAQGNHHPKPSQCHPSHPLSPGPSLLPPALSVLLPLQFPHSLEILSRSPPVAHFSSALSMSLIGAAGQLAGRTNPSRTGLCSPWSRECKKPHASPPHIITVAELCMGFPKAELHFQALQGCHLGQKQLGMLVLPAQGPGRPSCLLVYDVGRRGSQLQQPLISAIGSKPSLTPAPPPPLSQPQTYKPEALVALQGEPIHQVAGFVGTIRQDVAEMRLGDQRH